MGYRLGDRTTRVLRFLFGLHDPRVVAELAGYGFTEADRDEGWSLLIDGWENEWFPIAEASLRRKFPTVYKLFFQNLRQVEGKEAVMSVTVFLKRFDELSDPSGLTGTTGRRRRSCSVGVV